MRTVKKTQYQYVWRLYVIDWYIKWFWQCFTLIYNVVQIYPWPALLLLDINYIYFVSVFVLSICISVLWIDFWVFCISIFGYLLVFCISISLVFYNQFFCIFCICIFWDLFQKKIKILIQNSEQDTKKYRYKTHKKYWYRVLCQYFVSIFF